MVVKLKGETEDSWMLFDNVSQLSYGNEYRKLGDYDKVINIEKQDVKDNSCIVLTFLKDEKNYHVTLNTFGFIMNDQGETIERIEAKNQIQTEEKSEENSDFNFLKDVLDINDVNFRHKMERMSGVKSKNSKYSPSKSNGNNEVDMKDEAFRRIKDNLETARQIGIAASEDDMFEDFPENGTYQQFVDWIDSKEEVENNEINESDFDKVSSDNDPVESPDSIKNKIKGMQPGAEDFKNDLKNRVDVFNLSSKTDFDPSAEIKKTSEIKNHIDHMRSKSEKDEYNN